MLHSDILSFVSEKEVISNIRNLVFLSAFDFLYISLCLSAVSVSHILYSTSATETHIIIHQDFILFLLSSYFSASVCPCFFNPSLPSTYASRHCPENPGY